MDSGVTGSRRLEGVLLQDKYLINFVKSMHTVSAALFASMPSNLTHRIVINLLQENKQEKMKNQKLDAMNKMLKNDLSDARREAAQLKKVRDNAASSRAKVASREQTIKLLRQEMDGVKSVLSSADLMNQRLRLQNEAAEKKILRLITMMNKLTAEKAKLTESWSEAVRQHTAVTRELVVANKALKTAGRSERIPTHSNQSSDYRDRQPSSSSGSLMHLSKVRSSAVYRKRPRADGSKIPYPASFKKDA
ncbi:hypothetical protein PsorP6_005004 [Peronosclerospora sorghi]|uniref:Uncharacterized protein n=1 Tax=Peronosclerospora sorghi TaxID=230839 RepID=A0ACC0W1N4_9STRA|nr:hypothetical protein PsorP6_005004 [Peronosclerospora sorghi]